MRHETRRRSYAKNINIIKKVANGWELTIKMINSHKGIYNVLFDSEEILEEVRRRTWSINASGYAIAHSMSNQHGRRIIFLHHLILPKRNDCDVDHINRNPLDNRKENLRYATRRQNVVNGKTRCDNTSGVKGVSKCKDKDLWHAYIGFNGKRIQMWFRNYDDAVKYRSKLEKIYNADLWEQFTDARNAATTTPKGGDARNAHITGG